MSVIGFFPSANKRPFLGNEVIISVLNRRPKECQLKSDIWNSLSDILTSGGDTQCNVDLKRGPGKVTSVENLAGHKRLFLLFSTAHFQMCFQIQNAGCEFWRKISWKSHFNGGFWLGEIAFTFLHCAFSNAFSCPKSKTRGCGFLKEGLEKSF